MFRILAAAEPQGAHSEASGKDLGPYDEASGALPSQFFAVTDSSLWPRFQALGKTQGGPVKPQGEPKGLQKGVPKSKSFF